MENLVSQGAARKSKEIIGGGRSSHEELVVDLGGDEGRRSRKDHCRISVAPIPTQLGRGSTPLGRLMPANGAFQ